MKSRIQTGMARLELRSIFLAMAFAFICASCAAGLGEKGPPDPTVSMDVLSDQALDELEITFSRYPLPPPRRNIDDVKELIESFDFSHPSACLGANFYDVDLPDNKLKLSSSGTRRAFAVLMFRDAASKAFQYGDFEEAMNLLGKSRQVSLPTKERKVRANVDYAHSIFLNMIGNSEESARIYERGASHSLRRTWEKPASFKARTDAWTREAAAFNSYSLGRYREAELRFRTLRSSWSISGSNPLGFAVSSTSNITGTLPKHYKITEELYVDYLLILALIYQDKLASAEAEARRSMWNYEDPIRLAWIMDALSLVYLKQGRYGDAEWISRKLVDFFDEHCAPTHYFVVLRAYQRLADSLVAQGRWSDAQPYLEKARETEADIDDSHAGNEADRSVDYAIALMLDGDFSEASQLFNDALDLAGQQSDINAYSMAEINAFMAVNDALAGTVDAELDVESAIAQLVNSDSVSIGNDAQGRRNQSRTNLLIDRYLSLVDMKVGDAGAGRSFRFAQIGKSGKVQSALASSSLRARTDDLSLKSLLRKYQDLLTREVEIDRIYANLFSFKSIEYKGPQLEELKQESRLLATAKVAILQRLRNDYPDFVRLVDDRPLTVAETAGLLKPNESLVLVRITSDNSFVWATNSDGEIKMARVSVARSKIEELVSGIRDSVDPRNVETVSDIPEFDSDSSYALFRLIFEPVRQIWGKSSTMIVVADDLLQQLPMSLLLVEPSRRLPDADIRFEQYRDMAWLARTHAVVSLPSLASLSSLRKVSPLKSEHMRKFIGFGDPVFSNQLEKSTVLPESSGEKRVSLRATPRTRFADSASLEDLPPLPDTRTELLSISRSIDVRPEGSVFVGSLAQEIILYGLDLSDVAVISFATHGLVPGDLNGLHEPALALSQPSLLGDTRNDGLLLLHEILGLQLNADLVILSACNTAGPDGSGAEAVSGLGRAFFFAGAKSLLVSHWAVYSEATTELMIRVFEMLGSGRDTSRAEAVRQARVHLIERGQYEQHGQVVFSYAHPIFWAPFTLVGDGGIER